MKHPNPMSTRKSGDLEEDLLDSVLRDWQRERPDLDASAMAVVGRIVHLGSSMKAKTGQLLRDFDLHYTDLDVLATLRRMGDPFRLTPTELMRSVLLTSGAMTATLRRLEDKALIDRAADETDRRVRTVSLTRSGFDLIEKAIVVRFVDASRSVDSLTDKERAALASLLRKLSIAQNETSLDANR